MIKWIRTSTLSIKNSLTTGVGELELSVNTSTVVATDDWAPLDAEVRTLLFFFITLKPRVE